MMKKGYPNNFRTNGIFFNKICFIAHYFNHMHFVPDELKTLVELAVNLKGKIDYLDHSNILLFSWFYLHVTLMNSI